MLGDLSLATTNSELSVQMATEHDLAQPKAWSLSVAGWCAARNGDVARGIALATQAVDTMNAIQSRHFKPYLLGLLADAHRMAGHHAAAMKATEEGLVVAQTTGEHFYSAELHRLRGELLAHAPDGGKSVAGASFRTAVAVAQKQGAKTLERRERVRHRPIIPSAAARAARA
jgi:predicted ATPase